jgi:hypothetical protein
MRFGGARKKGALLQVAMSAEGTLTARSREHVGMSRFKGSWMKYSRFHSLEKCRTPTHVSNGSIATNSARGHRGVMSEFA